MLLILCLNMHAIIMLVATIFFHKLIKQNSFWSFFFPVKCQHDNYAQYLLFEFLLLPWDILVILLLILLLKCDTQPSINNLGL